MRRLSIARSVALALLGITVLYALLAGLGVAALYQSRQRYENRLSSAYALEAGAERLLAAAALDQMTARGAGVAQRRAARRDFETSLTMADALAAGDPAAIALLSATARQEAAARAAATHSTTRALAAGARLRGDVDALAARAASERAAAQASARDASRRALAAILFSALLVVIAVLALLWVLTARVRSPLAELAETARRLAGGDLDARVRVEGPQEVRTVAGAFNAMADDLAQALARLDEERARLARIVESLGEALLVVAQDGTIAVANPLARELLPELAPGTRVDDCDVLPPLSTALGHEVTLQRAGRVLAATAAQMPSTDGSEPSVVWTVRDVSERARLEALKTEFVATASHELRSPLTSIHGFVELLELRRARRARARVRADHPGQHRSPRGARRRPARSRPHRGRRGRDLPAPARPRRGHRRDRPADGPAPARQAPAPERGRARRPATRARGPRPPARDRDEPAHQRAPVHPGGRPRLGAAGDRWRATCAAVRRRRPGHRSAGGRPRVRPLLPRRGPAPRGRHGAGAVDRQVARRRARRHDRGALGARARHDLHRAPARRAGDGERRSASPRATHAAPACRRGRAPAAVAGGGSVHRPREADVS